MLWGQGHAVKLLLNVIAVHEGVLPLRNERWCPDGTAVARCGWRRRPLRAVGRWRCSIFVYVVVVRGAGFLLAVLGHELQQLFDVFLILEPLLRITHPVSLAVMLVCFRHDDS